MPGCRELSIKEMTADPVVRALMSADDVRANELEELRHTRPKLSAVVDVEIRSSACWRAPPSMPWRSSSRPSCSILGPRAPPPGKQGNMPAGSVDPSTSYLP
jgi:hypothetical protein